MGVTSFSPFVTASQQKWQHTQHTQQGTVEVPRNEPTHVSGDFATISHIAVTYLRVSNGRGCKANDGSPTRRS